MYKRGILRGIYEYAVGQTYVPPEDDTSYTSYLYDNENQDKAALQLKTKYIKKGIPSCTISLRQKLYVNDNRLRPIVMLDDLGREVASEFKTVEVFWNDGSWYVRDSVLGTETMTLQIYLCILCECTGIQISDLVVDYFSAIYNNLYCYSPRAAKDVLHILHNLDIKSQFEAIMMHDDEYMYIALGDFHKLNEGYFCGRWEVTALTAFTHTKEVYDAYIQVISPLFKSLCEYPPEETLRHSEISDLLDWGYIENMVLAQGVTL